ncbi:hypothetical protein IL54_3440 [Sphingobium sp. ba1]|jgi:hypothetical protein|nr:hypothetical protein IL54_3440 [Sphingobium sp. ba1]
MEIVARFAIVRGWVMMRLSNFTELSRFCLPDYR